MLIDLINDYLERFRIASVEKRYIDAVRLFDQMRREIWQAPPQNSEIMELLQELLSNRQLPGASIVFVSAWSNLSQDYVPLLGAILSSEDLSGWHEQAVELLGELANPDSIPALKKALAYRWDFDEWFDIPRKSLQALAAIGTKDALSAVAGAVNASEEPIRQEAANLLSSDQ